MTRGAQVALCPPSPIGPRAGPSHHTPSPTCPSRGRPIRPALEPDELQGKGRSPDALAPARPAGLAPARRGGGCVLTRPPLLGAVSPEIAPMIAVDQHAPAHPSSKQLHSGFLALL